MITTYKSGDYVAICDRCGEKVYGSMLRFDGHEPNKRVCKKCYWRKHPNDEELIVPLDGLPIPNARPEPQIITTEEIITYEDY